MKTLQVLSGPLAALTCGWLCATPARADNIAPLGTAILGVKAAIDGGAGTPRANAGTTANINDNDPSTRVDNWWGDGGTNNGPVSYVGVVWPALRYEKITGVTLTMAAFTDGGWFGVSSYGPSSGGTLVATNLVQPTLQVSTNGGVNWTTADVSSDYLTALTGFSIGGGANPNPNPVTVNFTLTSAVTEINGLRLIGANGGTGGDDNGFLGVLELEITGDPPADTDSDGLPNAWMTKYFGHATGQASDLSRSTDDADGDGLTNLQEYQRGTDPKKADTDGDGLNDGAEVNTNLTNPTLADTDGDGLSDGDEVVKYRTDPLLRDTDGDGLSDGDEVLKYLTSPLKTDTDGDGFSDGKEVAQGGDPLDPKIFPSNIGLTGTGIMGVKESLDSGPETEVPLFHVGVAENINDGDLTTRVDTYNGGDPGAVSFVGIVWTQPVPQPIARLELTLATFYDGGWFGPNNLGPGAGGILKAENLTEPNIEVTKDGGTTWTVVPHTSDYLTALVGHGIGGGANPNPTTVAAVFYVTNAANPNGVAAINGIRIIGTDSGTASGGFLGVFELSALAAGGDSDRNGLPDDWERQYFGHIGVDPNADADNDLLTNLEEYKAGTKPQVADTEGDGLNDGPELKTYHTDPLRPDTDADAVKDGDEVLKYHSNPLVADTDGDGFADGVEVAMGTDPADPASYPDNIASLGTGILGTKEAVDSGAETPGFNAGGASAINDGNLATRVDSFGIGGGNTASYVGILWAKPVTNTIIRLELSLATFFDGGWFGVNGTGPGSGGSLTTAEYLSEPIVQVTQDGGTTWTDVAATSDYLKAFEGHPLPAVDYGDPTLATAKFELTKPQTGINGIRILGSEGGTASGGFLGVFELAVRIQKAAVAPKVKLLNAAKVNGLFRFEFDSVAGASHVVQFWNLLPTANWQTLTTVAGDGTRKQVTDGVSNTLRIYRVTSQ